VRQSVPVSDNAVRLACDVSRSSRSGPDYRNAGEPYDVVQSTELMPWGKQKQGFFDRRCTQMDADVLGNPTVGVSISSVVFARVRQLALEIRVCAGIDRRPERNGTVGSATGLRVWSGVPDGHSSGNRHENGSFVGPCVIVLQRVTHYTEKRVNENKGLLYQPAVTLTLRAITIPGVIKAISVWRRVNVNAGWYYSRKSASQLGISCVRDVIHVRSILP
jgi:hypothetical protein